MSAFFERFALQVVGSLVHTGEIEIEAGQEARVCREVGAAMAELGSGHSAISSLSKSLLAHDAVIELYADDERLKELVGELGVAWLRQT